MLLKSLIEPMGPDDEFEIIDAAGEFLPGCAGRMKNDSRHREFFEPYLDRVVVAVTRLSGEFLKQVHCIEVGPAGAAEVEVKYEELTW